MKIIFLKLLPLSILITFLPVTFAKTSITNNIQQPLADKVLIEKTLTNFHQAAADANLNEYFNLLTDDAIYLGTDSSERWTKKTFKHYVEPRFKQGHGWKYTKIARHIKVSQDNKTAFFDELLTNKNYGLCRSTGMMRKTIQGWKIAQYSLSVPLPNAIAKDIVKEIKHHLQLNSNNTSAQ
jgi:ketosteroid isomerase-like protein